MVRYRISAKADRDLIDIWTHIAMDSEQAADRFHDLLCSKFRALGGSPGMGTGANQIAPNPRKFPVGEYIIYYRQARGAIVITRVLHGKRLLKQAYRK